MQERRRRKKKEKRGERKRKEKGRKLTPNSFHFSLHPRAFLTFQLSISTQNQPKEEDIKVASLGKIGIWCYIL